MNYKTVTVTLFYFGRSFEPFRQFPVGQFSVLHFPVLHFSVLHIKHPLFSIFMS